MSGGIAGTTALITDIERRKALPIIRALGREGVRVIGLSRERHPLGQYSRYCDNVIRSVNCEEQPERFIDELLRACEDERPDVLYPLEDTTLELCVQNRKRWDGLIGALVPTADALECAYDKWETIQVAARSGIHVPRTWCPNGVEEIAEFCGEADAWVIKPRKSSGSRGIVYVSQSDSLRDAYLEVARQHPRPLVQERLPQPGQGVGAFFLLDEALNPLAMFGHRRLREYPVSGGPSTLRESFRDDTLLEQSLRLVTEIGCVGVSMVEYKVDVRTGRYTLMEVNPRFWGSVALSVHAGVNFPALYHKACLHVPFEPALTYPTGLLARWLLPGDILHFFSNPNRFRMEPSFFRFSDPRMAYDFISTDDPWPMVGIIAEGLRKLFAGQR